MAGRLAVWGGLALDGRMDNDHVETRGKEAGTWLMEVALQVWHWRKHFCPFPGIVDVLCWEKGD